MKRAVTAPTTARGIGDRARKEIPLQRPPARGGPRPPGPGGGPAAGAPPPRIRGLPCFPPSATAPLLFSERTSPPPPPGGDAPPAPRSSGARFARRRDSAGALHAPAAHP